MNLLCIADLHYGSSNELGILANIPKEYYDAVVSLGNNFDLILNRLSRTLFKEKPYIAIKGSHDTPTMLSKYLIEDCNGKTKKIEGQIIGGLEGAFHYGTPSMPSYPEEEAQEILTYMGAVDILVSHNSPYDVHQRNDDTYVGFKALNKYIEKTKPKLVIHGHQQMNTHTTLPNGTVVISLFGIILLDTETYETAILFKRKSLADYYGE